MGDLELVLGVQASPVSWRTQEGLAPCFRALCASIGVRGRCLWSAAGGGLVMTALRCLSPNSKTLKWQRSAKPCTVWGLVGSQVPRGQWSDWYCTPLSPAG